MSSHDTPPPSGRLVLLRALRDRLESDLLQLDEQIEEELKNMASGGYHDATGKYVTPQVISYEDT